MFVTSFNEWWEGTQIEPDAEDEYGYTLLNAIKSFKDSGVQCDLDSWASQEDDQPDHEDAPAVASDQEMNDEYLELRGDT